MQPMYPLDVHQCQGCSHVQLLDVVDPEILFRDYLYVSSTSPVFVAHFERYAADIIKSANLARNALVLEIGSNDGTLLACFRAAGMRVLGVDPARSLAADATSRGIETVGEFFTSALAEKIRSERGSASVVAANNVFAHVDDLHDILEGVQRVMAPDGLFVFEVSYLPDVLEHTLFDTIYHEHLSYHSVEPLLAFFAQHRLRLIDAQRVPTHGGSLRGFVKHEAQRVRPRAVIADLVSREARAGLHGREPFEQFAERIARLGANLGATLSDVVRSGQRVAGYGAPAKATTLMYQLGIGTGELEYIIDDSPFKQGRFSPGLHIPIVPSSILANAQRRPDFLLILAWNFAESIIAKNQDFANRGGRFIVPLPELQLV